VSEGINRVTLLGNLGADPELRFTQGGQAVLNIRLATTESYLDKSGERKERTDWHSVTVWGKRGEGLAKILRKGSSILVEGRIQTSSYDDREGVKRYKTEIVANNVVLCGGRPQGRGGEEEPQERPQRAQQPRSPAVWNSGERPGPPSAQDGSEEGSPFGGLPSSSDDDIPF
jgi:single-strand DNA-binding protein